MISKAEVIPRLLQASPSFQNAWDEHCQFHEEGLTYIALGDFARHMLDLYRQRQTDTIVAVSHVIEQFHIEGDQEVREIATIGVLESIQNVWSHSDVDPDLLQSVFAARKPQVVG